MHIMGVWCDMAPQGAPLELYKTKHCWVEIKTDSEFLTQSDLGDTFCRAYFVIWQKRSQLRWQISPDWPSFGLSVHLQSTLQYMTSRPSAPQCQIVVSLCYLSVSAVCPRITCLPDHWSLPATLPRSPPTLHPAYPELVFPLCISVCYWATLF